MKTKGPNVRDVRVKFYWWPRRVILSSTKWISTGEKPIPYEPGFWHMNSPYPSSYITKAKLNAKLRGGMVQPVERVPHLEINGWVWLEHIFETYEVRGNDNGTKIWGWWRPTEFPKQWNLWHEYD